MNTAKRGKRLQPRNRTDMNTRQGRRSPNEEEKTMNKTLEDAGCLEDNMSFEEKRKLFTFLQGEQIEHVEQKTQRLSINTTSPISERNFEDRPHNSSAIESSDKAFDALLDDAFLARGEPTEKLQHTSPSPPASVDSLSEEGKARKLGKPTSGPGGASRGNIAIGRGRATPKVKYNPIPMSNPGQKSNAAQNSVSRTAVKPSTSQSFSSQNIGHLSPTSSEGSSKTEDDSSGFLNHQSSPRHSTPNVTHMQSHTSTVACLSPNNHDSPSEMPRKETGRSPYFQKPSEMAATADDEEEEEDVDVGSPEIKETESPSEEEKLLDSPASVQDAGMEADEGEEKDSMESMPVSKLSSSVSPLEALINMPSPTIATLPFFEDLEKYKENKAEWMNQAKRLVNAHRQVFWDRLLAESPLCGPPIMDCGFHKQTIFKQVVPKYSKLFGSSSDSKQATSMPAPARLGRHAKSQAMSKMQEAINDSWPEPEFQSLRQSTRQKESKSNNQQGNAWGSKKKSDFDLDDDVECMDGPAGVSDNWTSDRMNQKRLLGESDLEPTREAAQVAASHDEYDFQDDEDGDPIWPPDCKNKKNNKKGTKYLPNDVEVDVKQGSRSRGPSQLSLRGRNTKARVKRGDIARPSEHATTSGNQSRTRSGPEGDTTSHNNVNSGWINTDPKETRGTEIATTNFYSKVSQPRSPYLRPNEVHASQGAPGSPRGVDRDGRHEAASMDTTECPICRKAFPVKEIEAHCSECTEFAVGEETSNETQDSEGSDKTVIEVIENEESTSESSQTPPSKSKDHATADNLDTYGEDQNEDFISSIGQKRASSIEDDDGPAKKATRFMD